MTRENAKELLPIIEAYANGATIEIEIIKGCWNVEKYPTFCLNANKYRIKSEPSYRPFKDSAECWIEMTKHEPFGWIQSKTDNTIKSQIIGCDSNGIILCTDQVLNSNLPYYYVIDDWEFVDGTPFGTINAKKGL